MPNKALIPVSTKAGLRNVTKCVLPGASGHRPPPALVHLGWSLGYLSADAQMKEHGQGPKNFKARRNVQKQGQPPGQKPQEWTKCKCWAMPM
ncbi:g208 [Coccomyxa viridis]|uniref:G208 protein n=1 Tax=Coccomyxa viridis TaxID=1274662 RepID=A0ABP1FFE1_9CHLO